METHLKILKAILPFNVQFEGVLVKYLRQAWQVFFSFCVINECLVFILALDFIWHLPRSRCVLADVGCIISGKLLYPSFFEKKTPELKFR